MLSRKAGRAQALAAAGKFETPSPSPLCSPTSPQPTGHQSSKKAGRAQAQPHLTHPPAREAFPTAATRHSTYPFIQEGAQESLPTHRPGETGPQPPQEVYCCHHQEACSLSQTSSQEAEARVTFSPVRPHCYQQPLLP